MKKPLIVILGPTAIGKTKLACYLAYNIGGELISADSRQVYKGMDIGTGKDLEDFKINGKTIPSHLIDIKSAGEEYNVFSFQNDFLNALQNIAKTDSWPILCGGTGMYLEAALSDYKFLKVDENVDLRERLHNNTLKELIEYLEKLKPLHNQSDTKDRSRLVRSIEIAEYESTHAKEPMPSFERIIFGVKAERSIIKKNIHSRLKHRIDNGLIEEVEQLLANGITHHKLQYYGLEYKYVSLYLLNEIDKNQLFTELYKSISAYAKRQMTWFRRMEKKGIKIHWISAEKPLDEKVAYIQQKIKDFETV
ncbi:tRNA (adenosine(37)-N6)-dimethylallyltransferase MiaA [bacterium]|nr:tRNA (adenosine(37)-N6)-dimethylallyltransferase MiaA [bacterium]